MTTLYQDIKDKLVRLYVLEQVIVINVVVFIVTGFFSIIFKGKSYIFDVLALSNNVWEALYCPWTLISYGFLHQGLFHLFFNMLYLYVLAQSFANLFKARMALKIYILGILFGALAFLSAAILIPFLRIYTPLVGASAGVWACIIFLCTYMPEKSIRLFMFNFKLKYLAFVLIAYNLIIVFSHNSGGGVAHYGGGILGYIYARQLQKGKEFGQFLDKILDYFSSRKILKTNYRRNTNKRTKSSKQEKSAFTHQKQIDLILDKIGKSGYESLSQEEKDFLFRAGKK